MTRPLRILDRLLASRANELAPRTEAPALARISQTPRTAEARPYEFEVRSQAMVCAASRLADSAPQ